MKVVILIKCFMKEMRNSEHSLKKHILAYVVITMLLLVGQKGFSQDTISLEQSKRATLEYSNEIKNSRLIIDSAAIAVEEARSHYLPSVSATGMGVYGFDDIIEPIPEMLPEGVDNFYSAAATASEVIYAGGQIRTVNELAELKLEVNKIRSEKSINNVILSTEQKYWQLVNLQEQGKVLAANEIFLLRTLQQQQDLLDAGLIARNDMLRVKVQLSNLLLQKSRLDNGRKVAVLDFSYYIGIDYNPDLRAKDTLKPAVPPELLYGEPDTSLESVHNYKLLLKSMEAAELQTDLTRAQYLPKVSVGVSAVEYGVIDHSLIDNTSFLPLAFGVVTIPISDWLWGAGKHKMKEREVAEEMTRNNFEDGTDQLRVGILSAWYNFSDAYKEILFAEENLEQATENLKVSQDNYNSGLTDITTLLNAQASYQSAQSELINAHSNYEISKATYLYMIGEMDIPNVNQD